MTVFGGNKRVLYHPMLLVVCYLSITFFLFAFGPIDWPVRNGIKLYSLLVFYIVAFVMGYLNGISRASVVNDMSLEKERDLFNFTKRCLPIAIIIFIIIALRNYGFSSFDIVGLVERVFSGVGDIGAGYADKVERMGRGLSGSDVFGGTAFTLIVYIWDFFDYNILLLSIKFFKRGGLCHQILTIILCLLNVVFYVANGTNIGVFRILLAILLFYYIDKASRGSRSEPRKKIGVSNKKKFGIVVLATIFIAIFFTYFSSTMRSRGAYDNGASQLIRFSGRQLDIAGKWHEIMPAGLYYLLLALTSYTTQGYYGLSLALTEEWTPMFGLGSNMAVTNVLSQFWPQLSKCSYLYKIEQDYQWSSTVQWSSCYTWLANDVGFLGVIVIMFLLGKITAMSFSDAIQSRNPLASVVLYYMVLICLFLPANNQIGQSFATLFSMILALIWWSRTRRGKPYNRIKIVIRRK